MEQQAFYGPAAVTDLGQRRKALRQIRNMNPDRSGQISWTVTFVLLATLFAAAFVYGFLWINLPHKIDSGHDRIDKERFRLQVLSTILNNADVPECNCSAVDEHEFPTAFADNVFGIFNYDDDDKMLRIDASALLTSAQTFEVRDADGTVAYLSDIPNYPTVFNDDEFALFNAGDPTKQVMFDLSGLDPNSLVQLTIQPKGGIVAYLSDIPQPTSVYQDDVFAIQHAADQSREFQFDVANSGVGGVIQMGVQNASGIIAYISDLWENRNEFSDEMFAIHASGDPTSLLRLDLDTVSPLTTIDLTVQNTSGIVAYVGDLDPLNFATITEDRVFPDMAHEGFASLQAMNIRRVAITLCGGGGSGSATLDASNGIEEYNGGGGGGGFREFVINDVSAQFTAFNITIGAGGTGNTTTAFCNTDTLGKATTLVGLVTSGANQFQLVGHGGGCATSVDGSTVNSTGEGNYGGCGAGSGAMGTNVPGGAGDLGGVEGACGRLTDEAAPESRWGPFRYPWVGGSHGGATTLSTILSARSVARVRDVAGPGDGEDPPSDSEEPDVAPGDGTEPDGGGVAPDPVFIERSQGGFCTSSGECPASASIAGGFAGRGRAGGAAGLFGNGGDSESEYPGGADAAANTCAGGGSPEATVEVAPDTFVGWSQGGSGRVVIQYWLSED